MFRAMFSPIIRSTWLYLQYLVTFTNVAAGWCHGWAGTAVPTHPLTHPLTHSLTHPLTLALPIWIRFILFALIKNTNYVFEHLVTQSTPTILIPFIVIIETTGNLIRQGTLAVRQTAHIIAGHLLLTLLGNNGPSITAVPTHPWHQTAATLVNITRCCKYSQVILIMGENVARNT